MNRSMYQSTLSMMPLTTGAPVVMSSDQAVYIQAITVPKQEHPRGAYLAVGVGDMNLFYWSIDDAMLRTAAAQNPGAIVHDILDAIRRRERFDVRDLIVAERCLEALATVHMVRIEPVLVVPPRQNVRLLVLSGKPHPGLMGVGKTVVDASLSIHLACSWTRDVA